MCDPRNISSVLIYQYHVSFEPVVDSKSIRHRILMSQVTRSSSPPQPSREAMAVALQAEQLGVMDPIFDGMILYLPRQVQMSKLLATHPNTGEEVTVRIELTAELIPQDAQCTTFLNVTNRRVQELLGLVQIGRHFFDRSKSKTIPAHQMEVWPGYNTAIRRYEESLLLNIDVVHKLLRRESVLDFMKRCMSSDRARGMDLVSKELIGMSVLTRYNNKLYQVDDILWDKHPGTTTFEKRDGNTINLCQYIQEQYSHTGCQVSPLHLPQTALSSLMLMKPLWQVTEPVQPLLLSRAKRRGLDGNANADILLIPELCSMTG